MWEWVLLLLLPNHICVSNFCGFWCVWDFAFLYLDFFGLTSELREMSERMIERDKRGREIVYNTDIP